MKKVAGSLKMDQAQYNELESFSKFSSDVDKVTAMTLDRGRKNNRLLIQPQYEPMPVGEQIAVLYCGVNALMKDIALEQVGAFQDAFLDRMRALHQDVLDKLASGVIDDAAISVIKQTAESVVTTFK